MRIIPYLLQIHPMRTFFLFFIFFVLSSSFTTAQTGTHISVTVHDAPEQDVLLAYYLGNKTYIKDTFQTDKNGSFSIDYPQSIEEGIYLFAFPAKGMQTKEVILYTDQQFTLQFSLSAPLQSMMLSGSEDNSLFLRYQLQLQKFEAIATDLNKQKTTYQSKTDSLTAIDKRIESNNQQYLTYIEKINDCREL